MTNKKDLNKVEMKTFGFYKDEKVTYWERTNFSVKSETYEGAERIAKQLLGTELNESDKVSIDSCCFIKNIGVPMMPEQNDGISTIRIFNGSDQLIASNSVVLRK